MYKQIPQTDQAIRPFQVHKKWELDETDIPVFKIQKYIGGEFDPSTALNTNGVYTQPLYHSIKTQYYNDDIGGVTQLGDRRIRGINIERRLLDEAIVFTIPPIVYGEGIQRNTFKLYNVSENIFINDDGFSNLYIQNFAKFNFTLIDFENDILIVTQGGIEYIIELNVVDLENNLLTLTHNGETKNFTLIEINANESYITIEESEINIGGFLIIPVPIGNIFYETGIVVLNLLDDDFLVLKNEFNIEFNNTKTIYELEYFLSVEEDEFNISQNNSAIEHIPITGQFGEPTERTIPIVKRTFPSIINPSVSGSFSDYEKIGILDQTGSFLAPYITTIGLYNDDKELLAIAKLTQPIKSLPDYPVNFVIRIDT